MPAQQPVATPPWPDALIRSALELPTPAGAPPLTFSSISTDTRTLQPGALFVALSGDRFDGHDHLTAALAAGATGAIVRRGSSVPSGLLQFEVDDTLRAFGRLARARRRSIRGPIIAVTGTNGKTSTKEMLAAVLGT